jgi:cyanophycin synthetase
VYRADSLIEHAGRVAARGFHRLIIREDRDPRGRDRGAVAQILCDAALNEAPETDCQVVLDEFEALHQALKTMQHGEVVVVFYEKLEPLQRVLENYAAQPVQAISAFAQAETGNLNTYLAELSDMNCSTRRSISEATRLNAS